MSLLKGTWFGLIFLTGCFVVSSAMGQSQTATPSYVNRLFQDVSSKPRHSDDDSVEAQLKKMQEKIRQLEAQVTELKAAAGEPQEKEVKAQPEVYYLRYFRPKSPAKFGGSEIDFDAFIAAVQSNVATDSWDVNGGNGHIECFRSNLSLVITNDDPEVVKQTVAYLERIEQAAATLSEAGILLVELPIRAADAAAKRGSNR